MIPTSRNHEVRSHTQTITPPLAEAWLALNTGNRPVNRAAVAYLENELKTGGYCLNGEAIIFGITPEGKTVLLDGQHRLIACKKTGISFSSVIVTGVDPATFHTINRGRGRSLSDIGAIQGLPAYATVMGAAGVMSRHKVAGLSGPQTEYRKASPKTLLDLIAKHPGLVQAAQDIANRKADNVTGLRKISGVIRPAIAAYCLYLFRRVDVAKANYFFGKLASGEGLLTGNPIFTLREAFLSAKARRVMVSEHTLFSTIVRAWNDFLNGTPRKVFRMAAEDDLAVPEIKGLDYVALAKGDPAPSMTATQEPVQTEIEFEPECSPVGTSAEYF